MGFLDGILTLSERLLPAGLIAAAIGSYFGLFGPTGSDYFETCWERRAAYYATGRLDGHPTAESARQAVAWASCETITLRALYDDGLVQAQTLADDDKRKLAGMCPGDWSLTGAYVFTVDRVERSGGPTFLDKFLPAEFMVKRAWSAVFPKCSAERKALGYPKIVENGSGSFVWERPCAKCQ
jgi:hypothetical protein